MHLKHFSSNYISSSDVENQMADPKLKGTNWFQSDDSVIPSPLLLILPYFTLT